MSRILVFQHVAAEPLGTLDPLIRKRGHRIKFLNFERNPQAQPSIERYRGLIVLGGPMNVEDQHHRSHLKTEMGVIEQALVQGKPVLGICLGAQLLAHVLGAPVRRHHRSEIGWYPLSLTDHGRADPVFGHLGPDRPVFQWHHCSFDLPTDALHLARTEACENQAFRYRNSAYGFQFHPEVDRRLIERWLATPSYREDIDPAVLGHGEEEIRQHTLAHADAMAQGSQRMFNSFLDLIGRAPRAMVDQTLA
jgi:GMP synthase (glutamine-hydrolysing)